MSESRNLPQDISVQKRREYLRSLVLAIYRVTAAMPHDDYLRMRLREEALNIISHAERLSMGQNKDEYSKFIACAQTLVHYCEVAENESKDNAKNFSILKHAIFNIRNSFELPTHDKVEDEHLVFLTNAKLEPRHSEPAAPPAETHGESREEPRRSDTTPPPPDDLPIANFASVPEQAEQYGSRVTNLREWNKEMPNAKAQISNQTQSPNTKKKKGKPAELTGRQKKILEYFKENRSAQVNELANIFPSISKRTIRRDLDNIAKLGHIKKDGRTNGTQYELVS